MIIDLQEPEKKRIDKQGRTITNPLILEEIERLEEKKEQQKGLTVSDKMKLHNLLDQGDSFQAKNRITKVEKAKPAEKKTNLAKPEPLTPETIDKIINDLFKGINPFDSMKRHNISTRAFYNYLLSPQKNKEYYNFIKEHNKQVYNIDDFDCEPSEALRRCYEYARASFADSCLGNLFELSEQAKHGQIDSSTYNAITNNLRWIMAKLFPKQYAEKVTVDSSITTNTTSELDLDKIKQLASML